MDRMVRVVRTITMVQDVPVTAYDDMSETKIHDMEITMELADAMEALGDPDTPIEMMTIVQFYGGEDDALPEVPQQF